MIQATSCPSAPVLQRLLLGQSAEEESVSLEAHLLHCEKCLRAVKSLPPDDALISSLQEGRDFATQAPRSELLEKLRLRLQEMPASSRGSDTATGENTSPNAPTPSPEMMVDESVALAPPQQPDEIGRLGGYRVLKELGRGGMGVVFQAEDPKLKRLVALKVMLPRLAADASARRRFLREAQAMAAVHHDHVVTIYQVDEDNGVPFLAMEFLHGMPLDKWLKDGRKPNLAQMLRMGREIAEGLAAAHARGLIHRDIKPGNIWLDSDHKGPRQDPRFRPGPRRHRRRSPDAQRRHRGHAGLHVAGTGGRPKGGRPHRLVQPRLRAVPLLHRRHAVQPATRRWPCSRPWRWPIPSRCAN